MPVDEIIGTVVAEAAGQFVGAVVETAVDVATSSVFRGWLARYFHGIGRRLIAIATLGRKRIPSSLRIVPKGTTPKPRASDWLALWVGLVAWAVFAGLAVGAFLIW